jgi:hypothetical protein
LENEAETENIKNELNVSGVSTEIFNRWTHA